ncbi:MAG TPA: hypothetical protein VN948_06275 [Terriglobales bacterium]|nr:hypothetical protein [Terriglobales bacterium]
MKPFAGRKRSSLTEGERAQLSHSSGRRLGFLAAAVVIASSTLALAQAGQLDGTFGTGGIFTTNFTQGDSTMDIAVAIQSDGKIVVGGSTPGGGAVARLKTNGTLDSSFGTGGIVNNSFDLGVVVGVAIQPDGKILAAAAGFLGGSVGRFNPDGSIDTTFGNGGFASSKSIDSGPGILSAFALQADGKILVTGAGLMGRYTSGGQLDTTFGSAGIASLASPIATAMALQSDGKILVTTGVGAPTELFSSPFLPNQQAGAIARYNTNGKLDKTFGISGQTACVDSAAAIAIQSDGKIVVAGAIPSKLMTLTSGGITFADNQIGFGLVRYNSDGSVDTSFGTGGGVDTGFGNSFPAGSAFALAIQSNGEIVVAGQAGSGNQSFTSSSFALARYTTTGKLDASFGSKGKVITPIGQGHISFVSALALQSDGKIVAAGNSGPPAQEGFVDNFAIARYLVQ